MSENPSPPPGQPEPSGEPTPPPAEPLSPQAAAQPPPPPGAESLPPQAAAGPPPPPGQSWAASQAWSTSQPTPPTLADDPYSLAPVLVGFPDRLRQRRATVLVRFFLAIPHLVLLYFIGLVSFFVAVAGWFGALATGQLPQFAAQYLTGFLRWQARVLAYLLLLTDAYPPFSFEDADYPVRLYTKAVRLNRAAVLFRLILLLPVAFLSDLAIIGLFAWSFVIWLIALVAGTVPRSLHQAIAATIRFTIRYNGYALLLTPTYPGGLFGDRSAQPAVSHPAAGQIESGGSGLAQALPAPADPWTLVLTGRAKALVALCLVSGLLLWAGYVAALASVGNADRNSPSAAQPSSPVVPPGSSHARNTTLAELRKAYSTLNVALGAAERAAANCGHDQHCIQVQIDEIGGDFTTFSTAVTNTLQGIPVPAGATAAAEDLQYEASQATVEFAVLGQATSTAQYESEFKSGGAEQTLNLMSAAFNALISALNPQAGAA